jgi:hypothetical protein
MNLFWKHLLTKLRAWTRPLNQQQKHHRKESSLTYISEEHFAAKFGCSSWGVSEHTASASKNLVPAHSQEICDLAAHIKEEQSTKQYA